MRTSLRKSPRLKGFDYAGPYGYTVTVVTRRRQPVFRNANIVEIAREALRRACHQHGFTPHAYCFMPDHVHLLVSGNADSRLPEFVHLFKQLSGYHAKQALGTPLWQISYDDRVVRREEDLTEISRYIWNNPVRAGLADEPADYLYSGPQPPDAGRPEGLQLHDGRIAGKEIR